MKKTDIMNKLSILHPRFLRLKKSLLLITALALLSKALVGVAVPQVHAVMQVHLHSVQDMDATIAIPTPRTVLGSGVGGPHQPHQKSARPADRIYATVVE